MCRNDLEGIDVMDNINSSLAHLPPKVAVAVLREILRGKSSEAIRSNKKS